jgi:hypothetical protein
MWSNVLMAAARRNTYFDFSPETSAIVQSASSIFASRKHILTHDGGLSVLVDVVLSLLVRSRSGEIQLCPPRCVRS